MKKRKVPERSCIVCRGRKDKRDLLRIVRDKNGRIFYDPTGKANGRGAYICRDEACMNAFFTKNFLEKAFRQSIPKEEVEKIREMIKASIGINSNKADSEENK